MAYHFGQQRPVLLTEDRKDESESRGRDLQLDPHDMWDVVIHTRGPFYQHGLYLRSPNMDK